MDLQEHRFDGLTRSLTGVPSRRGLLRGIAATGLGLGATRVPLPAAAKCVQLGKTCKTRRGKKRCCGGAACKGKKCRCPADREPCGAACCATGETCEEGTCVPCDVCRSGCAFTRVQAAIDAADPGDTIRLCPGAYVEHVVVAKDLTLLGAGAGRSVLKDDPTADPMPVLTVGSGAAVEVRALTVTGGGGNGHPSKGGGILNRGALTLDGVDVTENSAGDGAGIAHLAGTLVLIDSRVSGNRATNAGGGLYVVGGTVALTGTRVTGNSAVVGGGIFNPVGTVTIEPDSVTNNTPTNCAGQAVGNCTN